MKTKLLLLFLSLAAASLLRGQNATITINAAATRGNAARIGSGFLNAFGSNPIVDPPNADYAALKIRWLRVSPTRAQAYHDMDVANGGNARLIIVLSDGWGTPSTGAPKPWGPDDTKLNWTAYYNYIRDTVIATKGLTNPAPIYDIWNEPDVRAWFSNWLPNEWSDAAKAQRFFETWAQAYNAINAADPNVLITGPGTGAFNGTAGQNTAINVTAFKNYCQANAKVPNYWNWHFSETALVGNVATAKGWGLNGGVMLLEHGGWTNGTAGRRPGFVAYSLSQIELTDLIGATKAQWGFNNGYDGPVGNCWINWSFGGKHGDWFVYKGYADMTGLRLTTSSSSANYGAYATLDNSAHVLRVLLGAQPIDTTKGNVGFTIQNVKAFSGSQVTVTIKRVPYNGDSTAVSGTTVISTANYTRSGLGTLTIPAFAWGSSNQAYLVDITNISN